MRLGRVGRYWGVVIRTVPLRVELGEAVRVPSRGCSTVGAWHWAVWRRVVDDRNLRMERVAFDGLIPGAWRGEVARRCGMDDWTTSR